MRIVVTGANGRLGSELCRLLGEEAIGLDLPAFDLTDADTVMRQLTAIQPEAIINTAAYTQVDEAEKQHGLCRAVNATGVKHLVRACREIGCKLVQISTDYVFHGEQNRSAPFVETDRPNPQGIYAQTKWEGEQHAATWVNHVIIRTCGLYGSRTPLGTCLPSEQRATNESPALEALGLNRPLSDNANTNSTKGDFVHTMLQLANRQSSLRVVADQRCTPSYLPHVACAIGFLARSDAQGIFHVVNQGETTWYEFALEIFRQAGNAVSVEPITTEEYAAAAPRPHYSVLSTEKYHARIGRPDLPRWQEALQEFFIDICGANE